MNAANSSLMGGGGVDGAIHRAGGPAILDACKQIVAERGSLTAGQAVSTTGGKLRAGFVIHTVGPDLAWRSQAEPQTLASCYRESLRLADQLQLVNIAFPSISTGAYGYPIDKAAADSNCNDRGKPTEVPQAYEKCASSSSLNGSFDAYKRAADEIARSRTCWIQIQY